MLQSLARKGKITRSQRWSIHLFTKASEMIWSAIVEKRGILFTKGRKENDPTVCLKAACQGIKP